MDSGKHTHYLEKYNKYEVHDFELFDVLIWEIKSSTWRCNSSHDYDGCLQFERFTYGTVVGYLGRQECRRKTNTRMEAEQKPKKNKNTTLPNKQTLTMLDYNAVNKTWQ